MDYTNEYSKLPLQIMERHYYKDVDNSIANEVNQIKFLESQGKYDQITEIIAGRPDLKQYIIGSDAINAIDEETRNLEIFAKAKKQQIYYENEEPEFAVEQDIWIGD